MLTQLIQNIQNRNNWILKGTFDNKNESFIWFSNENGTDIKYLLNKLTDMVEITTAYRVCWSDYPWTDLCDNWSNN